MGNIRSLNPSFHVHTLKNILLLRVRPHELHTEQPGSLGRVGVVPPVFYEALLCQLEFYCFLYECHTLDSGN